MHKGFITKNSNTPIMTFIMLMMGLMMVSACAPPPRIDAMVIASDTTILLPETSPLGGLITIGDVKFSDDTGILSGQLMTVKDLQMALKNSLDTNGYLASDDGLAPLLLNIDRRDTHKMQDGLEISWRVSLAYQLVDVSSNDIIMEEVIISSGMAGFNDASIALMRDRMALEMAIRNNFHHGLYRLRLSLQNHFRG